MIQSYLPLDMEMILQLPIKIS